MNTWEKLICGFKFFFGGFESAVDYLLKLLNDWLAEAKVAENVQKYYEKAVSVYNFLVKYQRYCPAAWLDAYKETLAAIKNLIDVFSDGKVEALEIEACVIAFRKAYEAWMKDDETPAAA